MVPLVLILEDEPRLRDLLLRALAEWGYAPAAARSGEEGMRLMESQPRQIVLADLNLPGMTGLEFCQTVRKRWPDTQLIILTGFGDLDAARQAIHLDVVEFLTKPAPLGDLEKALDRARRRVPDPLLSAADAAPPAPEPPPTEGPQTLDEVERQHILSALARNNGNRTATAAELGISLRTLYYRLTEYQKQGFPID